MSALTDLFSALATKIRSKTGGSDTYTPPEMVDAIDDVYAAGAASVPVTNITPSNANPVLLSANTNYKPSAAGYAVSGIEAIVLDNIATSSSLRSGHIYKPSDDYMAVNSLSGIRPSNSSPEPITEGSFYSAVDDGYAIASYQTVTPTSSGTDVSSGDIVKFSANGTILGSVPTIIPAADGSSFLRGYNYASDGGYAYSVRPTGGFEETLLWTNTAPQNSFPAQNIVNLDLSTYDAMKVVGIPSRGSSHYFYSILMKDDIEDTGTLAVGMYSAYRMFSYSLANTKINFDNCTRQSAIDNDYIIPVYIYGLKFKP